MDGVGRYGGHSRPPRGPLSAEREALHACRGRSAARRLTTWPQSTTRRSSRLGTGDVRLAGHHPAPCRRRRRFSTTAPAAVPDAVGDLHSLRLRGCPDGAALVGAGQSRPSEEWPRWRWTRRAGRLIPLLNAWMARASDPRGATAMWVRDRLDGLFTEADRADSYAADGPRDLSPARLGGVPPGEVADQGSGIRRSSPHRRGSGPRMPLTAGQPLRDPGALSHGAADARPTGTRRAKSLRPRSGTRPNPGFRPAPQPLPRHDYPPAYRGSARG